MTGMNETIEITKEGEEYIITRTIKERVTSEELSKIHGDIMNGLEESKKQLDELPGQMTEREKTLREQFNMLSDRAAVFTKHTATPEDPTLNNAIGGGP